MVRTTGLEVMAYTFDIIHVNFCQQSGYCISYCFKAFVD